MGSSAKITSGRLTSARATATRCCWPPDISFGRWLTRSARSTVSITCREPLGIRLLAGERERKGDVLEPGERRNEVVRLEHEADAIASNQREMLLVGAADLDVAEEHLTRRHAVEAGEAVQQRGLP